MNYLELFTDIENVKKILLVTTGRTGSDFFQSLLDGHPEILQFTGNFTFHKFWEKAVCKKNLHDLIDEFIWHTEAFLSIARFKSEYNLIERWEQLGENKNESFQVDINVFKTHMINLLNEKELNSKNFFIALNIAYGLAIGQDIKKIKILFYHIHHIDQLQSFKSDFYDFEVICTIRDPRNTIVSGLNHHKKYNPNTFTSSHVEHIYKRIFEESAPISLYTEKFYTLKLEDLHLYPTRVLKQFCTNNDIDFLPDVLLESTFNGKKWWGDAVSGKYLDGFNEKISLSKWQGEFFFYENYLIEYIHLHRLSFYNYQVSEKFKLFLYLPIILILIILPLKYELAAFKFRLQEDKSIKLRLYNTLRFLYHYIKRCTLFYKYLYMHISNNEYISKHFYRI